MGVFPVSGNIINEAFRVLRSNIDFMAGKDSGQTVFLLTSFNPGSGKSVSYTHLDVYKRQGMEYARDMFMLSFYTRGMSFVDIAYLDVYKRQV